MAIQYFYFKKAEAEILKEQHGGHSAVMISNGFPPLVKDQRLEFTAMSEAPIAGRKPVAVVDNTKHKITIEFVETDKLRRMETFGYRSKKTPAPVPQATVIDMESRRPAAAPTPSAPARVAQNG